MELHREELCPSDGLPRGRPPTVVAPLSMVTAPLFALALLGDRAGTAQSTPSHRGYCKPASAPPRLSAFAPERIRSAHSPGAFALEAGRIRHKGWGGRRSAFAHAPK